MATNIITCSIPVELAQFLEDNPEISPSKVLQQKLFAIKEEEARLQEKLRVYEVKTSRLVNKLANILRYCEAQNFVIPQDVLE